MNKRRLLLQDTVPSGPTARKAGIVEKFSISPSSYSPPSPLVRPDPVLASPFGFTITRGIQLLLALGASLLARLQRVEIPVVLSAMEDAKAEAKRLPAGLPPTRMGFSGPALDWIRAHFVLTRTTRMMTLLPVGRQMTPPLRRRPSLFSRHSWA